MMREATEEEYLKFIIGPVHPVIDECRKSVHTHFTKWQETLYIISDSKDPANSEYTVIKFTRDDGFQLTFLFLEYIFVWMDRQKFEELLDGAKLYPVVRNGDSVGYWR